MLKTLEHFLFSQIFLYIFAPNLQIELRNKLIKGSYIGFDLSEYGLA